jgi:thiol:disulfide interchange protein DsbD
VTVSHAQVHASLVAAESSAQPGKPFTVALRLEHQPHWHTYWVNAGTGYPTSLTWTLPPGWTASDIQWPVPGLIKDPQGKVTGHGYEGVIYLPVTITPAADATAGQSVTLKAKADWLMCQESCMPGSAEVQLALPIAAGTPSATKEAAELARQPMPEKPAGWTITATHSGKSVTLTVQGGGALQAPHFFSDDGFIAYEEAQVIKQMGDTIEFTLAVAADPDPAVKKLSGVLAYTDAKGVYRGAQVDAAFAANHVVANAATTAGSNQQPGGSGQGSDVSGQKSASDQMSAVSNQAPTSGSQLSTLNSQPAAASSLAATLALAALGGLILNFMPCVFPVLGIKILGFVNQSGSNRRLVTLHGLVFSSGVLGSFWTLAAVLAGLRAGGSQLGWGFQLQSPAFVFALAAVMLIFALSLSGVFEFGLRATGIGAGLQMKQGYVGSFFTGVLATVVATPCSAPFLAPALGAALALPTMQAFAVFTAIAVGLALPYLLLSIFPQAVKLLPRPGAWMETFKQFMAFPLYATVGYLLWVLAGQTAENGLLMAFFGLTLIAMAAWCYGRFAAPVAALAQRRVGVLAGLALLVLGGWTGWPQKPAASEVVWAAWSPEAVAQATAQGKTVYVDFTARWCATCQANKKLVFTNEEVRRTFRQQGIVTLKADWTNQDARITAELAKWGRSAVPFNLVVKPGQAPRSLPELLTPGVVLDAIKPS